MFGESKQGVCSQCKTCKSKGIFKIPHNSEENKQSVKQIKKCDKTYLCLYKTDALILGEQTVYVCSESLLNKNYKKQTKLKYPMFYEQNKQSV